MQPQMNTDDRWNLTKASVTGPIYATLLAKAMGASLDLPSPEDLKRIAEQANTAAEYAMRWTHWA